MQAARRLGIVFLLLVIAILALAAGSLFMVGQGMLGTLVAVAGAAALGAGGLVYWRVCRDVEALDVAGGREVPMSAVQKREPLRVQAMPVADLPPEYVSAVMRGARARLSVLRAACRDTDTPRL